MFKITRNTVQRFSLAEILLMAAINQIDMKRKAACTQRGCEDQLGVGHDR